MLTEDEKRHLPDGAVPVPGFEFYYATRCGQVWSLLPGRRARRIEGYQGKDERDQVRTSISKATGRPRSVMLKTLIAAAFLEPAPEGMGYLLHRDGDRANIAAANLYWASSSEATSPKSNLTVDLVEQMRIRRAEGETIPALAEAYGVTVLTVGHIVRGRRWKHAPGPITIKQPRAKR